MQTNNIDTTTKVNTDTIIEQLDAVRAVLDGIEEKVEPTPAPVPDHFKLATLYATPFYKVVADINEEAERFDTALSDAWSLVWYAAKSPAATKNLEGWEKAVELLSHSWYQQLTSLRNHVQAVREFAHYMTVTVATACECDAETLKAACEKRAEQGALYE